MRTGMMFFWGDGGRSFRCDGMRYRGLGLFTAHWCILVFPLNPLRMTNGNADRFQ